MKPKYKAYSGELKRLNGAKPDPEFQGKAWIYLPIRVAEAMLDNCKNKGEKQ